LRKADEPPWRRPLQLFAIVLAMVLFSQLLLTEVTLGTGETLLLTVIFYAIIFFVVFAFLRREV